MNSIPFSHTSFPNLILRIHDTLRRAGYESYVVGGAVRNMLLNKAILDWDMCTNAPPNRLMDIFPYAIPTGIKHGTITICRFEQKCELTSFRIDGKYTDGRHPNEVQFDATLHEDLSRRDFTMNAMAYDLQNSCIIDPFKGIEAIKKKEIVCVGTPQKRISEDYLRVLRAFRFSSQLSFLIEKNLLECLINMSSHITRISKERITTEIKKLLSTRSVEIAMPYLCSSEILEHIFHSKLFSLSKKQYHHIGNVLSKAWANNKNTALQLALLFSFVLAYNDLLSASYARKNKQTIIDFCSSIRISNKEHDLISTLLFLSSYKVDETWSIYHIRYFLTHLPIEHHNVLRAMFFYTTFQQQTIPTLFLEAIQTYIPKKKLAINGHDLMSTFGLTKGKKIGLILKGLYRIVLKTPEKNERETLLSLAKSLH